MRSGSLSFGIDWSVRERNWQSALGEIGVVGGGERSTCWSSPCLKMCSGEADGMRFADCKTEILMEVNWRSVAEGRFGDFHPNTLHVLPTTSLIKHTVLFSVRLSEGSMDSSVLIGGFFLSHQRFTLCLSSSPLTPSDLSLLCL